MLTAGLAVLGWIALSGLAATLMARLSRAGSERERSLPSNRDARIAWIRRDSPIDDVEPGPPTETSQPARYARLGSFR